MMNQFASGPKKSYYGKGDVIAYRLHRAEAPTPGQSAFFGVNAKILIYGESFWPTYTTGDNTGLIATDSMKNFIQRETMSFAGDDLESYCHFLADKFVSLYPQAEGAQISAAEIPYHQIPGTSVSYAPAGPERAFARIELGRGGETLEDPDETDLMRAAARGDLKTVQQLLSAATGANVNAGVNALNINALDQSGQTALILACRNPKANPDVVKALLAAGADVNLRSRAGYTPLTWAQVHNNAEIIRLLRRAEGRP